MLSQPTSSIEQRRKAHRRQNSTPALEVPNTNPRPFPAPIQRQIGPPRGHRRGLSLDQHMSFHRQGRMTPTLGPITQDDNTVQLTYTGQQQSQHPMQVAQQHSMAQPGQPQFHYAPRHQQNLSLETSQLQHHSQSEAQPSTPAFEFPPHPSHLQHSPEAQPSTPVFEFPQQSQPLPSPQSPHQHRFTPSPQIVQQSQFNHGQQLQGPCDEAVRKLKESVEAVYGPGSNVFINILPTPVATPQKRTSQAPMPQIETVPIPLGFGAADGLGLEPSNSSQGFEFHDSPEGSYYSPVANSPAHSPWHSPQQQPSNSFMEPPPQLSFDDHPLLSHSHFSSSQTTLADVEPMYSPSHGGYSPDRSPRQMSIADLNLDATIEDTGISAEEVAALIDHDTTSNTFRCMFEGCNKAGFQRRENVRSHVQTHLGDRPYKCIHCGKTFVRPHDLKRHAKIHSGVKPYQCPCGQEFVRQDALTRHRQRGSCCGAFPDAVPKTPARRGRPRKNRPEMDKRLDKAARTRKLNQDRDEKNEYSGNSSSSGSGSESENSPSPPPETQNFDFAALDTAALGELDDSKPQDLGSGDTEPFSFQDFSASSPCDYSSPFDHITAAEDMFFHLSAGSSSTNNHSTNNNAPTPPDSPSATGEPLIMDPLAMHVSNADDVFFGAATAIDMKDTHHAFSSELSNDMHAESSFWL